METGVIIIKGQKLKRKKPLSGILPHLPDETMVPGRMRVSTNGAAEAEKHAYSRQGTVTDFRRAYIIGGGDFGAAVHGTPDNYVYHIAKNDLWWDDFDSAEPCYFRGGLDELRERIAAGDPSLKQDFYAAANHRNNQPCQTSAARLTLHLCSGGIFKNIEERMELHSGTLIQSYGLGNQNGIVSGTGFSTLSCVSPAEDVMVILCNAGPSAGHMGKISLELTKDPMEISVNRGPLTPKR